MRGTVGKVWVRRLTAALCLCLALIAPKATAEQAGVKAQEITKKCTFKVTEGSRSKLTDNNVRTTWSYKYSDAYVAVRLPEGVEAGWLRIEWLFDPTGFELVEYDADLNALRRRDQNDTFPNIYTVFELLPETHYVQLQMTAKDQQICSVRVYSKGELPSDVQLWNPPVLKADLMVVSTHQDDELIFLGGTIPYYATALQKPTVVLYMANCTRYRRNEALNALWKMGVRNYPEFLNLRDKRVDSLDEALELWGGKDNVLSLLVERIRRFKPEVIVTQDLNGEYGHNQHKLTARAMMYAIEAAADPERYPESCEIYGTWQVKKLYHHLYKENQIMMDWETKLDSLKGYSPLKVAQIGMQEHASQLKYYSVKSHGTYDNAKFGLYFTTVGEDVAKNDFLENIDPDASEKYLAEHPEAADLVAAARARALGQAIEEPEAEADDAPTADGSGEGDDTALEDDAPAQDEPDAAEPDGTEISEPVATEEPEPEAETPQPTAQPSPANERDAGTGMALAVGAIGLGVAAVGAGGWYGYRLLRSGGKRRRRSRR